MDINALFAKHLDQVRDLAQRHQADYDKFVIVGATAVLLHWHEMSQDRRPLEHAPRMTADIDIAVTDQDFGLSIISANKHMPIEVLRMITPEGRQRAEFAFEDPLTVEFTGGVKVLAAGVVALFVMKTGSASADGRWTKRGSDLRDLYSLLRIYGAGEVAHRFRKYLGRDIVETTVRSLRQLLAHEGSRGYVWLLEEMDLSDADGLWVRQAFDLFFHELTQGGFSLE